ncbi:hypothetical protein NLX83_39840 [Allokutzneria sp. A3M-2-11 16]|uniref:hypothetical protein n=1 Tax=Allokutzneria sp. A3M-2-11 16 TaxID=2962043 RepID=UPI0020B80EA9|nr:hypothetical protein [Allokutzneria sp. A3M-2-11 16]MCP3805438.1 hypothetical protein [Allokutzneria sp. A3M-2-11 16]
MTTQPHTARPQPTTKNKTEQVADKVEENMGTLRDKASEAKDRIEQKLPPEVSGKVEQIMAEAKRHPVKAALVSLGALSILRRLVQRKRK